MKAIKLIQNSAIACGIAASISGAAYARNLDAGYVLNDMNADQRVSYIQGMVEGLAYARWLRDRPSEAGFQCVVDWYQNDIENKWSKLEAWFARHPDKPVSVLLHVMIKKECGE